MEAYEFLDVEAELVALIRAQVRVKAFTQVPTVRDPEDVLVARVGGTADRVTDSPVVTFFAASTGWSAAFALVKLLRQRLMSVQRLGGLPVYRVVEVGGPTKAPDPATGQARYQLTIQFFLRGSMPPP